MVKNLFILLSVIIIVGCNKSGFNLENRKNLFLKLLEEAQPDEGPFRFNYDLETIYVSNKMISLYGELHQYTNLPHGSGSYEGKTYIKCGTKWNELTLNDLFPNCKDIELLRSYCENDLKNQAINYFAKNDPLHTYLDAEKLNTFVIDKNFLIIIFQPYAVGSYVDGPFTVQIPHEYIHKYWKSASHYLSNI